MTTDILEIYKKDVKLNGTRSDGSQIKVMIVDDSLAFRRLLKRIFENTGYLVAAEVADGKEAVQQYDKVRPDVVTMDVTMPELEGPASVEAIRKVYPEARIIMVSSLGHKELVEEAIAKGAKGYILKPITDDSIPKVLETIKKTAVA
ncbi:MAG: response regulator [bacterium]|nr:response regulator [bacterium]